MTVLTGTLKDCGNCRRQFSVLLNRPRGISWRIASVWPLQLDGYKHNQQGKG
jgi:hypothetical protein